MKTFLTIILLLISLESYAFTLNDPVIIVDNGTGQACESESIWVRVSATHSVDDGDGNDHFVHALLDARGIVLGFEDDSVSATNPTAFINIFHNLTAITARPLTFIIFEKTTTNVTPGGTISGQVNYAMNNYQLLEERIFDPVEFGMDTCDIISELFCHDPLIYKSGVEALICGENDEPMINFTLPLGMVNLCVPPTTFNLSGNDFEVCNTSCTFGGTGCDLQLDTQDLVNFTENQLCATYTFSAPNVTVNNNFFGNCEHNIVGDYYIGTFWEGSYSAPFSWFYTMPDMVMKWFNPNFVSSVGAGCNIASALNNAVESYIATFIQDYYQNHFNSKAGNVFCEIVE